jgi:hypothetical protein
MKSPLTAMPLQFGLQNHKSTFQNDKNKDPHNFVHPLTFHPRRNRKSECLNCFSVFSQ